MSISAKIVADSLCSGVRITTMELHYPRFIHSEVMTHRMFSRNASSSRAIPIEKNIRDVLNDVAMPIHWGKNQPGMQAREEIEFPGNGISSWKTGAARAILTAKHLLEHGLHKQIVNRVLEPFQWIKVIVTATEWDNFFKLRNHPDAQPEMMVLAEHMLKAIGESEPKELKAGEWHLPYYYGSCTNEKGEPELDVAIKCSVARCARVSYLNHDNTNPNIEKDLSLADMLLEAGHMSPFEHQATPMAYIWDDALNGFNWEEGITHLDEYGSLWSGNFRGFIQYRQTL